MKERFKPFNNHIIKSKNSLLDNIKLFFRLILDLQVNTVFKTIKKYINTTVNKYSTGGGGTFLMLDAVILHIKDYYQRI